MNKLDWVQPLVAAVQELMDRRFWNEQELARRSGKDPATIAKFLDMGYKRGPDFSTIRAIVGAFGKDGVKMLIELGHEGWAESLAGDLTIDGNALAGIREVVTGEMRQHLLELTEIIKRIVNGDPRYQELADELAKVRRNLE